MRGLGFRAPTLPKGLSFWRRFFGGGASRLEGLGCRGQGFGMPGD